MSEAAEQTSTEEGAAAEVDENLNDDKALTAEDVAREGGWKPIEEWEGDKKEWRSAEVFNERGDWIQRHKVQEKRLNDMESSFNTRMDNANKLHQQQIELQKADLINKRDASIDLADKDAANGYQEQIDKINANPVESAPASNDQGTLDTWNTANPWILGTEPKAAYAKQQFALYQGQNMSASAALAAMESDVNRAFPDINPNRDNHPSSEGGSKPGKKRGARKLSMSDLTSEELKYYRAMPDAWGSQADYLQAVQDTRGES